MEGQIETKNQQDLPISQPIAEINLSLEQLIDEKIKIRIPDTQQRDNVIQSCKDLQNELKQPLDEFVKNMNTFTILKLSKITDPQEIRSFLLSKFDEANPEKSIQIINEDKLKSAESVNIVSKIKEDVDEGNEALQALKGAKDAYDKLDPKFKTTDEQLATYKQSLPLGAITDIARQLEGTGMSTDEFLQLSYTANTYPDKLEGSDFLKNYEQAKDFLEIPNAWLEAPSTMKTLTKPSEIRGMVKSDSTLSDYVNNKDNFHNFDSIKYLELSDKVTKDNIDLIKNFGNKELQDKLKTFQDDMQEKKYDQYFDAYGNILKEDIKLPDGAKEFYKNYRDFFETSIQGINDGLNTQKNQIIREESLGTWFSGIANLCDTTTFNKENFSSDFKLGKNAFSNDNGTLAISGSMNDTPIKLSGNPSDKNSLQINGFAEGPTGVFKETKEPLDIKTPTVKQLSKMAENLLKTPGMTEGIMASAKSPQEFQEILQHMLAEKLRDKGNYSAQQAARYLNPVAY